MADAFEGDYLQTTVERIYIGWQKWGEQKMECLRWRGHNTKRTKPETMQQQVRDQVLSARWRFFQFTRDFIAFEDHVQRDLQIAGRSASDLPILTQFLSGQDCARSMFSLVSFWVSGCMKLPVQFRTKRGRTR